MNNENPFEISEDIKKTIDIWIAKYPEGQQRSAVLEALLLVQKQNNNWLSDAAMNAVADYLKLPRIMIYEVATFYDLYNLKPIGKHKISICTNVSCMLSGCGEIIDCLYKKLGIGLNDNIRHH